MNIGILHNKSLQYGGSEYIRDVLLQTLSETHHIELFIPKRHIKLPYIRRYIDINRFINTRKLDNNDLIIETSGSLIPIFYSKKPYIAYCNGLSNTKWHRIPDNITIISNSNYTKNIIKSKLGINTEIIYPPIDIQSWNNNNNKSGVITTTRPSKEKNPETLNKIMKHIPVKILYDIPHNQIHQHTCKAKVFLSTSIETFGISTVESIASGCIPIVPNNSAHLEAVPFNELRYNNIDHAIEKIQYAINGEYDHLIPSLQQHIQQFDQSIFINKFNQLISKMIN